MMQKPQIPARPLRRAPPTVFFAAAYVEPRCCGVKVNATSTCAPGGLGGLNQCKVANAWCVLNCRFQSTGGGLSSVAFGKLRSTCTRHTQLRLLLSRHRLLTAEVAATS